MVFKNEIVFRGYVSWGGGLQFLYLYNLSKESVKNLYKMIDPFILIMIIFY